MVTWSQCRGSFQPDGSLRDIYILGADAGVWESALTFLRAAGALNFRVDGVAAAVPTTARQALGLRPAADPALKVQRQGMSFACHFFSEQEVELDFAPSEINGPERFDSLVSFLHGLGSATGREVLVAPENQSDRPFLRYNPRTEQLAIVGNPA